MTVTSSRDDAAAGGGRPRTQLDLAAQRLRAIASFDDARRTAEQAAAVAARSREMRMDAARSLEVLRREHDAVLDRAHQQLELTADLLRQVPDQRVVLAHRSAWFTGKVAQGLEDQGLRVVARLDNARTQSG